MVESVQKFWEPSRHVRYSRICTLNKVRYNKAAVSINKQQSHNLYDT